ncbi:MAG: GNAT family N-acetyltransferase [Candidatus Saccharimonadales bacterium]
MNIRPAELDEVEAIANIYIASFKAAMPAVKLAHNENEIKEWFKKVLVPNGGTWVADDEGNLVGFMSLDDDMLEELYLTPSAQGKGVGSMLMEKAKQLNPTGLKAYTFQINNVARKFYEKHGFVAVSFNSGERNEEHEPDILYEWKPKD